MIFYGLLILLVIEQIFCFQTGSYPYRYGIPVKTVHIPGLNTLFCRPADIKRSKYLAVHINNERKEIYIRYKYPGGYLLSTGGPRFFLGQIKYETPDRLRLRVGPATAVFSLCYVTAMLSSGKFVPILLVFLMVTVLGIWFYRRLINAVVSAVRENRDFRS
jgi:hypothetical protein